MSHGHADTILVTAVQGSTLEMNGFLDFENIKTPLKSYYVSPQNPEDMLNKTVNSK